MKKLKTTEIKTYREVLLIEQDCLCGLCGEPLSKDEAVWDHNHQNGKCRKVLHRGCNALEGIIANNSKRNRINKDRLQKICMNLINYLDTAESDLLHPTHLTPEERLAKIRKRAAKKRKLNKK